MTRANHLNYEFNQVSADGLTSLEARSYVCPQGETSFEAAIHTPAQTNTPLTWASTLYSKAPPTTDGDSAELYHLLKRMPEQYNPLSRDLTVASWLGHSFTQTDRITNGIWYSQQRFTYPSIENANAKASEIFADNGMTYTRFTGGLYSRVELLEAIASGTHLDATRQPWQLHGRATHELGERALGKGFYDRERETFTELLEIEGSDPESRKLQQALLAHDALTDHVGQYVMRANKTNAVDIRDFTNLDWLLNNFWSNQSLAVTSIGRSAAQDFEYGKYPDFVKKDANDIRERLAHASKILLQYPHA